VAKAALTTIIQKITAWSYSRWNDYCLCPLKAKYKHVDKIKEPGSAAMDRGSKIHELAEHFVKGIIRAIPAELKIFAEEFKALKKAGATAEQDWAFNRTWEKRGWFDKDVWVRVKVDAFLLYAKSLIKKGPRTNPAGMLVIDYKTGKLNPDHIEQLSLYALAAFKLFKEVEAVDVELWYLDQLKVPGQNPVTKTFLREDERGLQKEWEKRTIPMLSDTKFAPRPNNKCHWCWFRHDNADYPGGKGPCKF
jgi:CRISPR/Cas system-associated exonuclease Cas4 (RecB family)